MSSQAEVLDELISCADFCWNPLSDWWFGRIVGDRRPESDT